MQAEMRKELTEHILPFWMGLLDEKNGGYYGFMDTDLTLTREAEKGCILNSRILWTFSNAATLLDSKLYLPYAKHAFLFLKNVFWDREHGGIYWSVDAQGKPLDTIKHSYNTAFAIYGLSSYYEASGEEEALLMAKELYLLLETRYKDAYGYREAFTVDFGPQSNEHLSENGVMASKTMNTTLHIFEAYTELYRVSGFEPAKESLHRILELFGEKIYNPQKKRMEVFFDEKMNTLIDLHSYGHDIETAWLLARGLAVLGEEPLLEKYRPMLESLEDTILNEAFTGTYLPAECENGKVLKTGVWWVQCEAVIGFVNAWQQRPQRTDFLAAAGRVWDYLKEYFVDTREGGEWYNERFPDGSVNKGQPVVSPWKCPYHNSRMCMEMIRRMGKFDCASVNPNATEKARSLLAYLAGVAGNGILTGQHTQTNPMEERAYIYEVTGHYPKLVGFEMLSYSPNINFDDASNECLTEVYENEGTLDTALSLAKKGEIVPMICFHWFSPLGGSDKSFYTEHTDFDPEQVLVEGTPEREAFYSDLDVIAEKLRMFLKEDIAVLWRPFHETEGTWFWWGSKGGKVAAELYRMMYRYFTEKKKLNHLLWVWSPPTKEAYPGDEFVDIIGWDIYLPEKKATDYAAQYAELRNNTTRTKVAALTEVGYNPDIEMLEKSRIPWAFYMTWSHEFAMDGVKNTKDELKKMYESGYSVKLS